MQAFLYNVYNSLSIQYIHWEQNKHTHHTKTVPQKCDENVTSVIPLEL